MKIIQNYVIRELLGPVIVSLLIITFILLSRRLDDFLIIFTQHEIGWKFLFRLTGLLLPYILTLTLPMGLLIACLIVFSRWNTDRELLALRVSGVSPWKVVIPLIILSIISSGVLFYFTSSLVPWTYAAFRRTLFEMAVNVSRNLNTQSFNKLGNNLVIYVQEAGDLPGEYRGVTLFYSKDGKIQQVLTATKGSVDLNLEQEKTVLTMSKGAFYRYDPEDSEHFYIGKFERWQSVTDLNKLLPAPDQSPQKPREFSMEALRNKIQSEKQAGQKAAPYRIEYSKRFAFPVACIVFVLLGIPLGASWKMKNRTLAFFMGIILIVIYWIILEFSETLGLKGQLQPELAVWLPNLVLGTIGLILTWRTCRA